MKNSLYCLLLFTILQCPFQGHSQNGAIMLGYASAFYKDDFLGQLNTLNKAAAGNPVQEIFYGIHGQVESEKKQLFYEQVTIGQYLSQSFSVNDSVTGRVSGWNLGMGFGMDFIRSTDKIDWIFGIGANMGRMKLVQSRSLQKEGNILHLTNAFFSPKGFSTLIFFFDKGFSLSAQGEYMFDVTASRWREKWLSFGKPDSVPVPGFRQSGLRLFLTVGYSFPEDPMPEEEAYGRL